MAFHSEQNPDFTSVQKVIQEMADITGEEAKARFRRENVGSLLESLSGEAGRRDNDTRFKGIKDLVGKKPAGEQANPQAQNFGDPAITAPKLSAGDPTSAVAGNASAALKGIGIKLQGGFTGPQGDTPPGFIDDVTTGSRKVVGGDIGALLDLASLIPGLENINRQDTRAVKREEDTKLTGALAANIAVTINAVQDKVMGPKALTQVLEESAAATSGDPNLQKATISRGLALSGVLRNNKREAQNARAEKAVISGQELGMKGNRLSAFVNAVKSGDIDAQLAAMDGLFTTKQREAEALIEQRLAAADASRASTRQRDNATEMAMAEWTSGSYFDLIGATVPLKLRAMTEDQLFDNYVTIVKAGGDVIPDNMLGLFNRLQDVSVQNTGDLILFSETPATGRFATLVGSTDKKLIKVKMDDIIQSLADLGQRRPDKRLSDDFKEAARRENLALLISASLPGTTIQRTTLPAVGDRIRGDIQYDFNIDLETVSGRTNSRLLTGLFIIARSHSDLEQRTGQILSDNVFGKAQFSDSSVKVQPPDVPRLAQLKSILGIKEAPNSGLVENVSAPRRTP